MFAAGELAMTAHDLALWDESLIAQSILKPESYKQMFTEVKLNGRQGNALRAGRRGEGPRAAIARLSIRGEVSGFVAENIVLVDDGVAVAVLTNQDAVGAAVHDCASGCADGGGVPAGGRRKTGGRDFPRFATGAH
jgi:D-alanyl-D-alanine carboxypeptidase